MPEMRAIYEFAFNIYSCFFGYSKDTCGCGYDNKTICIGGVASGRTVD